MEERKRNKSFNPESKNSKRKLKMKSSLYEALKKRREERKNGNKIKSA